MINYNAEFKKEGMDCGIIKTNKNGVGKKNIFYYFIN